jgi:DNA-binding protein HU-beta
MNKAQLIDAISANAGLTKADAKKALDAFVNTTTEALKQQVIA